MLPAIPAASSVKPSTKAQLDILLENIEKHEKWRNAMHSRLKSIGDDANINSKRKYYLVTTQNISTGRVRRRYRATMQQQQNDGEERTTRQILEDQKKFLINYRASLEERRRQLLLPKTNDVMTMGQRDSSTPKPGIEIIVSRHSVTSNGKRDQQQGQLPKINTISTRDSGETTPVIITGHKNKPAVPQFLDVLQCKAKTNKPGLLLTPNRKYRVENWLNSISMS